MCHQQAVEVRHQTMQVKTDQTKQTADVQDSQKDTSSSDNKNDTSYKSADEITMDDLMSHDETPAEDFEFNDSTDNIIIEKYVGKDPIVVIPDEIDGKKVVGFHDTFTNDKNIIAVRIGDNITEIDRYAFGNAENLKYLVLGESVKSIDGGNFFGTNLKELILNDGLERIGEDEFTYIVDPPLDNSGMDLKKYLRALQNSMFLILISLVNRVHMLNSMQMNMQIAVLHSQQNNFVCFTSVDD